MSILQQNRKAMKRPSNSKIAQIYQKKAGNVSVTCEALGISRTQFYTWKNKFPKLKEMLDDVDEALLDFTESKLTEKINDGDLTAIIFFLKTKGKKRGYVESVENNVTVNPFEALLKSLPDEEDS